jgi:hypothetical protein
MKPITDKAEVSIDFPDKAYMGSFGHDSRFEVKAGTDEASIKLVNSRLEEKRVIEFHVHYYLLADILAELAEGIAKHPEIEPGRHDSLAKAAAALHKALGPAAKRR